MLNIVDRLQCTSCSKEFSIYEGEQLLRDKLAPVIDRVRYELPLPTHCEDCRFNRRLAQINERHLYYRTCDATGKTIVSNYRANARHKVYEAEYWMSDKWDPMVYGREVSFTEPFFDQFQRLHQEVPRMSLDRGAHMENSDYNNHVDSLKDCYMCIQCNWAQQCTYCTFSQRINNTHFSTFVFDCEHVYESINARGCYGVSFSENIKHCSDSIFLARCTNVKDSICCVNLHDKQYCIFNKQYTKEEYEAKKKEFYNHFQTSSQEVMAQFHEFAKTFPEPSDYNIGSGEMVGEYLDNCADTYFSYRCKQNKDAWYAYLSTDSKDVLDSSGYVLERGYEALVSGEESYGIYFSTAWDHCRDIYYSDYCFIGSHDLFGCVGLKRKQYCILNKQYSKEEYFALVHKIIAHMKATGEWGEFFPERISPFPYIDSVAMDFSPLSPEEIQERNFYYTKDVTQLSEYQGKEYLLEETKYYADREKAKGLLGAVLRCEETGGTYKILPSELAFCLRYDLPLPRLSPSRRYWHHIQQMNSRNTKLRTCASQQLTEPPMYCEKEMYSSSKGANVYCRTCFREMGS